jgi:hypothetical protein
LKICPRFTAAAITAEMDHQRWRCRGRSQKGTWSVRMDDHLKSKRESLQRRDIPGGKKKLPSAAMYEVIVDIPKMYQHRH